MKVKKTKHRDSALCRSGGSPGACWRIAEGLSDAVVLERDAVLAAVHRSCLRVESCLGAQPAFTLMKGHLINSGMN